MQSWQNVVFVEKALISETMWAILIENQIECGNQTLRKWNVMWMVLQNHYMYVLLVWDPTKLKELSLRNQKLAVWASFSFSSSQNRPQYKLYPSSIKAAAISIPTKLLQIKSINNIPTATQNKMNPINCLKLFPFIIQYPLLHSMQKEAKCDFLIVLFPCGAFPLSPPQPLLWLLFSPQ